MATSVPKLNLLILLEDFPLLSPHLHYSSRKKILQKKTVVMKT